jgi:hypothetical protein
MSTKYIRHFLELLQLLLKVAQVLGWLKSFGKENTKIFVVGHQWYATQLFKSGLFHRQSCLAGEKHYSTLRLVERHKVHTAPVFNEVNQHPHTTFAANQDGQIIRIVI